MIEAISAGLGDLVHWYAETKLGLEQSVPFEADWLHLFIGPMIFAAAALALRKPASAVGPWFVVVLLAVLNEMVDLGLNQSPNWTKAYVDGTTDLLLTIAIPTALLILSRRLPAVYGSLGLTQRASP